MKKKSIVLMQRRVVCFEWLHVCLKRRAKINWMVWLSCNNRREQESTQQQPLFLLLKDTGVVAMAGRANNP